MNPKPQTPKPAAPITDVDAIIATTVEKTRATDRKAAKDEALKKAGCLTEPVALIVIGGVPGRPYQPKRTKFSEHPQLAGDPRLWPNEGQLVLQGPGDIPMESYNVPTGQTWFRAATAEEIAATASDQDAAAYLREEGTVAGARAYADSAVKASEENRKRIEKLERELAAAKVELVQREELEAHAAGLVEQEKARLSEWVAASGKSQEAIAKAVELLRRKPDPSVAAPAGAHFNEGHQEPVDWKVRAGLTGGVPVLKGGA